MKREYMRVEAATVYSSVAFHLVGYCCSRLQRGAAAPKLLNRRFLMTMATGLMASASVGFRTEIGYEKEGEMAMKERQRVVPTSLLLFLSRKKILEESKLSIVDSPD
ncbi:hypothetical protein CHUAL_000523 [Chamberlinius hualienensis]